MDATLASMGFFVRAIATGFAMSLGAALFKKVAPQLGLAEDQKSSKDADATPPESGAEPVLQGG